MENTRFQTALYILLSLAHHQGEQLNSTELAKGIKTNPVFVRRILSLLSKAGLIKTAKGRNGGVALKKNPDQISLHEVYKAVALPKVITSVKKTPNHSCPVSCSLEKLVDHVGTIVDSSVEKSLARIQLSQLVQEIRP